LLVGFASRHVCPKLPQFPVSDSLQSVKRASTHANWKRYRGAIGE
jgi:hypothetical protein